MKKFFCVAAVCAAAVFCCGCGEKRPVKMQSVDTAMGTVIQQNIYTTDELSNGTKEILDLLRKLEEQELSRRIDTSEIWAAMRLREMRKDICSHRSCQRHWRNVWMYGSSPKEPLT